MHAGVKHVTARRRGGLVDWKLMQPQVSQLSGSRLTTSSLGAETPQARQGRLGKDLPKHSRRPEGRMGGRPTMRIVAFKDLPRSVGEEVGVSD